MTTAAAPRSAASYENCDARFLRPKGFKFVDQFYNVYESRLNEMRDVFATLEAAAGGGNAANNKRRKVGEGNKKNDAKTLIHFQPGDPCSVSATVFKEHPNRPDVIEHFVKELAGHVDYDGEYVDPFKQRIASANDKIVFEDNSGRISVKFKHAETERGIVDGLVTGVIMHVEGKISEDGDLIVDKHKLAGIAPQSRHPPCSGTSTHRHVLLVSGLHMGGAQDPMPAQLLVDYVNGHIGTSEDGGASVVRVCIAGHSVVPEKASADCSHFDDPLTRENQKKLSQPIRMFDTLLSELASNVPVDLMPGGSDPASLSFPQQPIDPCVIPEGAKFSSLQRATNPHEFKIEDRLFLGTDGRPLHDVHRHTLGVSPLEAMESTLQWRHIAPTCPDTISGYPSKDRDPLIIRECPHVYFAGNQDEYASKIVKGPDGQVVRVVCVPRFASTFTAVLVNIDSPTYECTPITFGEPAQSKASKSPPNGDENASQNAMDESS